MKTFLVTVIFVIAPLMALKIYCQDLIYWELSYQLKWSDFKGKPPQDADFNAGSSVNIDVQSCKKSNPPNFIVRTSFDKTTSWKSFDSNDIVSNLLIHERTHFDIAEFYSRKIRSSIDSLQRKKVKIFEIYTTVISKFVAERDIMDKLYDKETDFSLNSDEQKKWSRKINLNLEYLSNYKFDPNICK